MIFRTLTELHLSLLAAAYGRTGQYDKSLDYFKMAQIRKNDFDVHLICFGKAPCGISHPEIWMLAEDAVRDHRSGSSPEKLVRLALIFALLPVPNSVLVCDDIARKFDLLNHNDQRVFDSLAEKAVKNLNEWLTTRRQPALVIAKDRENPHCRAAHSGSRRVELSYI